MFRRAVACIRRRIACSIWKVSGLIISLCVRCALAQLLGVPVDQRAPSLHLLGCSGALEPFRDILQTSRDVVFQSAFVTERTLLRIQSTILKNISQATKRKA